jgi:hypothetical protein
MGALASSIASSLFCSVLCRREAASSWRPGGNQKAQLHHTHSEGAMADCACSE